MAICTWVFLRMLYLGKIYGISNPDETSVNTDLPVSTRTVPDLFGGYTEVHGTYREEDGLFLIRELRDEKLSKLNFVPGYAGTRRITPDASPVYTR